MISNKDSLILFKFSSQKWIKSIEEGNISFSCPGHYIEIAKKTGNDEQGDPDEGIFARLKTGDPRIEECMNRLKDDLEIIYENNGYVKLRRRSSYLIPTFCFYSYTGDDLLSDSKETYGIQDVSHDFDDRMFGSFTNFSSKNVLNNDFSPATIYIKPRPFKHQLQYKLFELGVFAEIRNINYTEFEKDEFFIEPDHKRSELFYKFPRYSYQKEARICLYNNPLKNTTDRMNINIGSLREFSWIFNREISFKIKADIRKGI